MRAFTIIELIFVIVILGILGMIAIPKFLAMKQMTEDQIVRSFVGTLDRTVGQVLWSKSLAEGHEGSIKTVSYPLQKYVDIPTELNADSVDFSRCVEGNATAQPFMTPAEGYEYNIFCRDGNSTDAPKFVASKDATYTF